jgi:hypothetical protein
VRVRRCHPAKLGPVGQHLHLWICYLCPRVRVGYGHTTSNGRLFSLSRRYCLDLIEDRIVIEPPSTPIGTKSAPRDDCGIWRFELCSNFS